MDKTFVIDIVYYNLVDGHIHKDDKWTSTDMWIYACNSYDEALLQARDCIKDTVFLHDDDIPVLEIYEAFGKEKGRLLYTIAACDEETGEGVGIHANEYNNNKIYENKQMKKTISEFQLNKIIAESIKKALDCTVGEMKEEIDWFHENDGPSPLEEEFQEALYEVIDQYKEEFFNYGWSPQDFAKWCCEMVNDFLR